MNPAELELAGVAAVSRLGARLAARRVSPSDFESPAAGLVVAAASVLDDVHDVEDRLDVLAGVIDLAGYRPMWTVHGLAHRASVWSDTSGSVAARVIAGRRRREAKRRLVDAWDALDAGVDPDEVLAR